MYDMPGRVYFRVLFHFYNNTDVDSGSPGLNDTDFADSSFDAFSGLLAPVWLGLSEASQNRIEKISSGQIMADIEAYWNSNTAFSYLMINGEQQRARNLKDFVELLSNINTQSPWYFQKITGIDTAVDRQVATNEDFQFKAERDKITIETLDDSYDQRIGTLLDLYRSVVWSWETKRVMIPANLRKFDMTIIAFQLPLRGRHVSRNKLSMTTAERRSDSKSSIGSLSLLAGPSGLTVFDSTNNYSAPVASYKAYEFHGCEFDYNSSKSGQAEVNNIEGTVPKYNIDIFYDDMYEIRWNEFMGRFATDLMDDTQPISINSSFKPNTTTDSELDTPIPPSYQSPDTSVVGQLVGAGMSYVTHKATELYLGNLYGLSISKIGSQLNQLASGDLWATVGNVSQYISQIKGVNSAKSSSIGENICPKPDSSERIRNLGNIFRSNTALNS
jgi:hypothetical protein